MPVPVPVYATRLVADARWISHCICSSGGCPAKQVMAWHPDEPQAGAAGTAGQGCAATRARAAGVLGATLHLEQYLPGSAQHRSTTAVAAACPHADLARVSARLAWPSGLAMRRRSWSALPGEFIF